MANIKRYPATDNSVSFLKRFAKNFIKLYWRDASDPILTIKYFGDLSV
jgi:hypothetical protein